ncbi:MAG: hypothetical protein LBB20_02505 [Puniceicoccales bacterium]|nr:hypothetical protein [Puniceicoccales bacterium]
MTNRESGFALVLVVSTITLITGLLIAFSTISSLQKTKIDNLVLIENAKYQARLHALAALNEAIARLNYLAAQDKVVTARANIINHASNDKAFWIGVWRVDKCNDTDTTASDKKEFLGWLVSQNGRENFSANDDINSVTSSIDSSYVKLIDDRYVSNAEEHVYAQKVDLKNSVNKVIGHHAYWIDDESLKAQCNLPDDRYADFPDAYFLKRSCPQRNGLEMLTHGPINLENNVNVPNTLHYSDLILNNDFGPDEKTWLAGHFHDLACCSRGLLTDTRNGGFRKNLTWYFESSNDSSVIGDTGFVFPSPTNLPEPPTTWDYVKSFYRLKYNYDNGAMVAKPTYPLYHPQTWVSYDDCSLNESTITGANANDLGIPTQHGIFPIWTDFKIVMLSRYYSGAPDSHLHISNHFYDSIRMQPVFVNRNPYTRNINGHSYSLIYAAPYISTNPSHQQVPTFNVETYYQGNSMTQGNSTITDIPLKNDYSNYIDNHENGSVGAPIIRNGYRWPLFDCKYNNLDFPNNSKQFISLSGSEPYIKAPAGKPLTRKIDNIISSPSILENYGMNDIRKYQNQNSQNKAETSTISLDIASWQNLCLSLLDNTTGLVMQEIDNINLITNNITTSLSRNIQEGQVDLLWVMSCYANDGRIEFNGRGNGLRWLANANPRAPIIGKSAYQDKMTFIPPGEAIFHTNWNWPAEFLDKTNLQTETIALDNNVRFPVLFDLPHPTYGFLNLGFLQHMNTGLFGYHPAYGFGNSYQNPLIPREKFFQSNAQQKTDWPSHYRVELLYDYSYCLNRALWDSCFMTGLHNKHILNKRLRSYSDASIDELDSIDAAKKMYINGAFNINSTSREAWIAVLGSTLGLGEPDKASYYRCLSTESGIGEVKLDKNQLGLLATKIVEQIKVRGPFGSIGEFVNRTLIDKSNDDTTQAVSNKQLGLSGVLQRAIDDNYVFSNEGIGNDSSSLNTGFSRVVKSQRKLSWYDDAAASGQIDACAPGYLTQADLLQSLGSILAARGDSFSIHSYGDSIDQNGNLLAKTKCEAIVQRLPDPNDINHRVFRILAIKWVDL